MNETIDGLPVDVPAPEVKKLAEDRAAYHERKAAAYATQQQEIERLQEDDDQPQRTSMNAARDLRSKASEHTNKAAHLRFVATHLKEGAVYRLREGDLVLLGVKASRY